MKNYLNLPETVRYTLVGQNHCSYIAMTIDISRLLKPSIQSYMYSAGSEKVEPLRQNVYHATCSGML